MGKVVLISGAARGLGRLLALSFGQAGAIVVVADIDGQNARKVQGEIESAGGRADSIEVDLSQSEAAARMICCIADRHRRLDVLINNARAGERKMGVMETEKNWDDTLAVCCKAPFFASQKAIEVMKAGQGGAIVNISSIAGRYVSVESASYHAAKAALIHLTRFLAVRGGPFNVRVNAVAPGFIVQDEHIENFQALENAEYRKRAEMCQPLGRVGTSGEVVSAVMFLCSDAASFVTGQILGVDGGITLRDSWNLLTTAEKKANDNDIDA